MKFENCCCAHYLIPDFSAEFLDESEVQVYVEQPYPISKPLDSTGVDIIQKFHEDKEAYFNQLLTIRKDFNLVKERVMNQSFENSHITISKGLSNFCNRERFEAPFTCDYNPFYGSSSLEYFTLNNRNYLVRPDSKNNLCVNNVAKPWKNHKLILETALDEHEHITKIVCKTKQSDVFLLLQLKHELNLIAISDIGDIGNIKFKKKFKKSVIDSSLNDSRLGVILFDTKFRLYDVESDKKLSLGHSVDSAIKFEFVDHYTIGFVTQNSLKIIDQRCKDHKLLKPELDECDKLCSFKIDGNEVYLGSHHYLIRTDLRFSKDVEFCTHLMKTSPCYIDCVDNNNSKILCLSSQKCDEKVLFTGNPIGSLPFQVPNISDTLMECRIKNDILLLDQLEERLQSSTRGLKLVCEKNSVDLFTANYFGDIFKQKISTTVEQSETDPIKSLHKWVQKLPESPKILNLTDIVDMSSARFALNKLPLEDQLTKFTKKSKKATLFLNHYNNIYNKRNLSNLAANFVAIWEDEEESEEVGLVPEVAPIDKVSSWIESSYFFE